MSDIEFDLRYISLGAGVQSTAMYLMACEGIIGPKPDFAVFADTQNEPKGVYENVDWLKSNFGHSVPIHSVTAGNLLWEIEKAATPGFEGRAASVPFWASTDTGRGLGGIRICTVEYKINVIRRFVRRELGLKPKEKAAGRFDVECWIGISLDEVTRAKPNPVDEWIHNRWPLIYDHPMRRSDCIDWIEGNGYPVPARSACNFCPYRSHRDWVAMSKEYPDEFAEAVAVDELIRANGLMKGMRHPQFVHQDLRPLAEVVADPTLEDRQIDMWDNECEGVCGV